MGCQQHKQSNQRISKTLPSDVVLTIKEKNISYFEDDPKSKGVLHAVKPQRHLGPTTITDDAATIAMQHENLLPVATGDT